MKLMFQIKFFDKIKLVQDLKYFDWNLFVNSNVTLSYNGLANEFLTHSQTVQSQMNTFKMKK